MKKIFKYLGIILSAALMLSSCNIQEIVETADLGLGIKVFFPTKVVAGQEMTINGSGFSDAVEVVFPDGVTVTDFEIVSNDMIRVVAPKGISSEGGTIKVRTADDEAESRLPLTIGYTVVSGYSKQAGEAIQGGEQITVYGEDLEFISCAEFIDAEGNPLILNDEDFYRKGTSNVIITLPKYNIFTGSFIGKLYTFDGRSFDLPELAYEPAPQEGGHWEIVKNSIWKGDGSAGEVSWSGQYRFGLEGNDSLGECIATFSQDVWDQIKGGTFYVLLSGDNPQIRVTTGWWSTTWTGADIQPGNELLVDNGDGTWTLTINLEGDAILDVIDAQHLLLTGGGYTPLEIYFETEEWVAGEEGHWENRTLWKGDGSAGEISWNGIYRFGLEGNDGNNECIATFSQEDWDLIKGGTFYLHAQGSDWVQMRITTGWWSTTWTGADITTGDERIIDNGDGTFDIAINFEGDPILDLLDAQHLLFTGGGYTPLEIYVQEWVEGSGPSEVVFWETDGSKGEISWGGDYRFGLEGNDGNNECIATFAQDVWDVIKGGTFYLHAQGSDWVQMRITTGWWSTTWTGADITTGDERIVDNGDGTYDIAINFEGDPILDVLDAQHLLLTGSGYTPLKLYYYK